MNWMTKDSKKRRVEIYLDERVGYASQSESSPDNELSYEQFPSFQEIANDPEFCHAIIDLEFADSILSPVP